jgi:serine/threonine-protein kinase HipA
MTCNGKRDNFTLDDLLLAAKAADVKRPLLHLESVQHAMTLWPEFAGKAGLSEKLTAEIGLQHRSFIDSSQISVATAEGPAQRSLF